MNQILTEDQATIQSNLETMFYLKCFQQQGAENPTQTALNNINIYLIM